MAKFILGKKIEMTQKFLEDGTVVPVTVVKAGPCTITQVKKDSPDGYTALQVGFAKTKKLTKSLAGHLQGLDNFRYLQEFRMDKVDGFKRGKVFDVTSFTPGDMLSVTATSKGKGFQGVVRRHGFAGSPATHGHKDQLRMPGSIGSTGPQRVFKGTRMGGHMGDETVTVHNLELIEVDAANNLLYIKGAVPGARNTLVTVAADGELKLLEAKAEAKPIETKIEDAPEAEAKAEDQVKQE